MLTHIVFFRLKERTPENVAALHDRLMALTDQIPQIRHFEVGIDMLPSERSYDLALYSRFDSADDLKAYQVHPKHLKVAEYIKQVAEPSVKVNYES